MKSSLPLTAKYRPQLFSEVAGQAAVRQILSRAAAESRVAPAYLFSGTRGVGKTTIARIFAKALNCERGPAAEPCNCCESCRQITQGMAVDVHEIDGASNRGIDDAKRLKEDIGYAPLEGRYKVFIIDEAHMLTREAFNALLKTLEEPPAKVTFILATTEPHKFPSTIVSRCQHFIFKQLGRQELKEHLSRVLASEGIGFEEEAVDLLARRAAGSVRDGMSLLGQVLAIGSSDLTVSDVESVLGLAGQDLFLQIVDATARGDALQMAGVVETLLAQGVEMGFFLRELTRLWRNLFILRHSGEAAFSLLNFGPEEGRLWQEAANRLELAQLHAAWQLTLEGQRRVLTSLEPGQALELLLLNIALLPSLLPVSDMPDAGKSNVNSGGGGGPAGGALPESVSAGPRPATTAAGAERIQSFSTAEAASGTAQKKTSEFEEQASDEAAGSGSPKKKYEEAKLLKRGAGESEGEVAQDLRNISDRESGLFPSDFSALEKDAPALGKAGKDISEVAASALIKNSAPAEATSAQEAQGECVAPRHLSQPELTVSTGSLTETEQLSVSPPSTGSEEDIPYLESAQDVGDDIWNDPLALLEWKNFLEFCRKQRSSYQGGSEDAQPNGERPADSVSFPAGNAELFSGEGGVAAGINPSLLERGRGAFKADRLLVECPSDIAYERLCRDEQRRALIALGELFWGKGIKLEVLPPPFRAKTRGDLRREAQNHPVVVLLKEKMGAYLLDCAPEYEN
ncbi:MAG: DNA polymerase III subunit gamma/tau [Desulfovibrionaceae bacterium]|nr:DNA polymerase III subunit gamma/tau [Desulfovibrionaceae bacterium]